METGPTRVWENMPSSGYPGYRPTCIKSSLSNPPVHVMKPWPIQQELGCITNKLEPILHSHT